MLKSLIKITLFSVFLFLIQLTLSYVLGPNYLHAYLGGIIVFFWAQFIFMHILSDYAHKYLEVDMTLILLGGVSGRLIIAIIAMVAAVVLEVPDKRLFIVNFSVVYLCYLVFEITSVLSNLRTNLK